MKASVSLYFGRSLCLELETKFWLLICPFILVGSETNNLGKKFRIHDAALSRLAAVVAGAQLWIKGITESQLCWNFESVYLVHVAAFRVGNTWNSTCVFSAFSRILSFNLTVTCKEALKPVHIELPRENNQNFINLCYLTLFLHFPFPLSFDIASS